MRFISRIFHPNRAERRQSAEKSNTSKVTVLQVAFNNSSVKKTVKVRNCDGSDANVKCVKAPSFYDAVMGVYSPGGRDSAQRGSDAG